jgi:hypothetical protein
MANDFVMLEILLFRKFDNIPIFVQNPITYFSMDETYNLSIINNFKYYI